MPEPRGIIHIDMDAFYASVEQRDDPRLAARPLIVGGHPTRGVVLAASYEVRPFGVRSAMSMVEALRRAPQAVVVPPRFSAYVAASEEIAAIFERYTPLVEPLSLDEAFLDVTASRGLFGDATTIARAIRAEIAERLRLPASAGIAAVKFVAKIASDFAKPNGQRTVTEAETKGFLAPLEIGRLWGVGRKTEAALKRHGLHTIGDLAAADPRRLERRFPGAQHLWDLSQGIDPREVIPDRAAKSIGAEDTFEEDLEPAALAPHIHGQAERVARRLRRAGLKARVVQLKLKLSDFTLLTRRTTLREATDDGQTLYRTAEQLLERDRPRGRLRLTGVAGHELQTTADQLGLFAPAPTRSARLNAALDRITERFGDGAVTTADLTGRPDRDKPRGGG